MNRPVHRIDGSLNQKSYLDELVPDQTIRMERTASTGRIRRRQAAQSGYVGCAKLIEMVDKIKESATQIQTEMGGTDTFTKVITMTEKMKELLVQALGAMSAVETIDQGMTDPGSGAMQTGQPVMPTQGKPVMLTGGRRPFGKRAGEGREQGKDERGRPWERREDGRRYPLPNDDPYNEGGPYPLAEGDPMTPEFWGDEPDKLSGRLRAAHRLLRHGGDQKPDQKSFGNDGAEWDENDQIKRTNPETGDSLTWTRPDWSKRLEQRRNQAGAHQAYDVFLDGEEIDTVFYSGGDSAQDVHRSLVNHDGYDPGIVVRRRDANGSYDDSYPDDGNYSEASLRRQAGGWGPYSKDLSDSVEAAIVYSNGNGVTDPDLILQAVHQNAGDLIQAEGVSDDEVQQMIQEFQMIHGVQSGKPTTPRGTNPRQ